VSNRKCQTGNQLRECARLNHDTVSDNDEICATVDFNGQMVTFALRSGRRSFFLQIATDPIVGGQFESKMIGGQRAPFPILDLANQKKHNL
jgi:hypothetical protein